MNRLFAGTLTLALAMLACSSGSGGGGSSGNATFSCNATTAGLCTQLVVPASEVSQESSTCTNTEKGTPGTGCPTANLLGCCKLTSTGEAAEEQCYYTATAAMAGKSVCTGSGAVWSTTM